MILQNHDLMGKLETFEIIQIEEFEDMNGYCEIFYSVIIKNNNLQSKSTLYNSLKKQIHSLSLLK